MTLEKNIGIARNILRAILFLLVASWVGGLAIIFRISVINAQLILGMIGLAAALVFLDKQATQRPALRLMDVGLAIAAILLFGYAAIVFYPNYGRLVTYARTPPPYLIWMTLALILLVLEAARRKTGPVLPILVVLLIVYFAFIGPSLPVVFETKWLTDKQISSFAFSEVAMVGRVMEIVGQVVIPFIVFGFLLNAFGGGVFFTGLATKLVGQFRGGPAKVSVVGSAAFGMISGSAVANVVTVGAVSIPLMARTGYKKHVAAAIEAVTSTGGQLMPPIMGASAFLMAEFLEIPYRDIVVAAILPAMFFYIALFMAVDFEARRLNIQPSSPESLGLTGGDNWTKGAPYLLPVAVLLYLLFIERRTAGYASFYTVAALMAVYMFWPSLRRRDTQSQQVSVAQIFVSIARALVSRFRMVVKETLNCMGASTEIILLGATASLIVGLLGSTGFSSNMTQQMVILSQGHLLILLSLSAMMGLFLGMGMPTVGVYILLALLAAPALVDMGVNPLAAHLYVLYFGMLSMITPPVAIASFAAASVADTNPWRTSFSSIRIGAGVYLVPIAFVTQPELLFIGDLADTGVAATRLLIAISLFTVIFIGHGMRKMPLMLRIISVPLSLANVLPLTGGTMDYYLWAGFGLSSVLLAMHLIAKLDAKTTTGPQHAD